MLEKVLAVLFAVLITFLAISIGTLAASIVLASISVIAQGNGLLGLVLYITFFTIITAFGYMFWKSR